MPVQHHIIDSQCKSSQYRRDFVIFASTSSDTCVGIDYEIVIHLKSKFDMRVALRENECVGSPKLTPLNRIWNKSNSTAGRACRGKSAGRSAVFAVFYNKCIKRKCFTLKMKVKVTEYNIHNGANRSIAKKLTW